MPESDTSLNIELFEIKSGLQKAASSVEKFVYEAYFAPKAYTMFDSNWERYSHVVNLLSIEKIEATVVNDKNTLKILTFSKPKALDYFAYGLREDADCKITIFPSDSNDIGLDSYAFIRTILMKAIKAKLSEKLKVERNIAYDATTNLTEKMSGAR